MSVICSLSGVYRSVPTEEIEGDSFIDLTGIGGTNGYCDAEAQQRIRTALQPYPAREIHLIDNGNYHYMTRFWLEKLETPFYLAVFDHHTDMQPSALLPILSCGNWLADCLADPKLPIRKVWLIGPPEQAWEQVDPQLRGRVRFVEEAAAGTPALFPMPEEETGVPVYFSVDKDVLSPQETAVTWDQGTMRLETLIQWFRRLTENRKLLGADLCGEPEEHTENTWNCNRKVIKELKCIKDLTLSHNMG